MTKTIEIPDWCSMWGSKDERYGSLVKIGEPTKFDNGDGTTCENTVTIYHNQNPIALAECEADDGNGGYYYSVGSLVIGKIHFPVVEA